MTHTHIVMLLVRCLAQLCAAQNNTAAWSEVKACWQIWQLTRHTAQPRSRGATSRPWGMPSRPDPQTSYRKFSHRRESPSYLCDFNFVANVHQHFTRSSQANNVFIPRCSKRSLRFNGFTQWNLLPAELRNAQSLPVFKRECSKYVFTHCTRF